MQFLIYAFPSIIRSYRLHAFSPRHCQVTKHTLYQIMNTKCQKHNKDMIWFEQPNV